MTTKLNRHYDNKNIDIGYINIISNIYISISKNPAGHQYD
ncbi:hypothetical protein EMIT0158MI4_130180 [Burkholderia ambifaria]